MTTLLECLNVSFKIRQFLLLDNISFSIKGGEILTIIGPNGAGKTTLSKVIAGILKPTSGTVSRKKRLKMSYMPQKLTVNHFLPMTVGDFLANATEPLSHKKLKDLSGGEWQRVLLNRCLLKKPELLILDEPTQGVDLFGEQEMYRKLLALRNETGVSIIMISHDLHLVFKASDRVLCLNHHICCQGHPLDVSQSSEYQKLFPSVTLYPHHHDHCHYV